MNEKLLKEVKNDLNSRLENEIVSKNLNKDFKGIADSINNVYSEMFSKTYFLDMLNGGETPFDVFQKEDIEFGNKIRTMAEGPVFSKERGKAFIPTKEVVKSRLESISSDRIERHIQNTYPLVENERFFQSGEGYAQFIANQDKKVRDAHFFEKLNIFKYIFGAETSNFLTPEVKTKIDPLKDFVNKHTINLGTIDTLEMITTLREKVRLIEATESDKWNIGSASDGADLKPGVKPLLNSWNIKTNGILIMSIRDAEKIKRLTTDKFHPEYYLEFKEMFERVIELDIPSGNMYLLSKECIGIHTYFNGHYTTFYPENLQNVLDHQYDFAFNAVPFANGLKFTWTNK